MMSGGRPAVSDVIERQVRQRCFFGCVVCGMPIFDYDHIEEYSVVKEHTVENITLLCPNHHREKSAGRLHGDLLRHFNANPYNRERPLTSFAAVGGNVITDFNFYFAKNKVKIGLIEGNFSTLVSIDYEEIVAVRREGVNMLLSLRIYDENSQLKLNVIDGRVQVSTDIYDYSFVGKTLKIHSAAKKIDYVLEFRADGLKISRGSFQGNMGTVLNFSADKIVAVNARSGLKSCLSNVDQKSSEFFCLVVAPDIAEISPISVGGNIGSESYLKSIRKFSQLVFDSNLSSNEDKYYLLSRLINTAEGVARHQKNAEIFIPYLGFMEELREVCLKISNEMEYAKATRGLGRELWRYFHRSSKVHLIHAIVYLDEALSLKFIKETKSELARARSNKADALVSLYYFDRDNNHLREAINLLSKALEFYGSMPISYGEEDESKLINRKITALQNILTGLGL